MVKVINEFLDGVTELQAPMFGDDRGVFSETWNAKSMSAVGLDLDFVQDNQSLSVPTGTVRGLHLQLAPHAQGKLVRCIAGAIYDVAVDVRPGSATFGQHAGVRLDPETGNQLWVPPGFAHGFCTLEPNTVVAYKVTEFYAPEQDRSILWNDPEIGIEWPVADGEAVLSDKDAAAPPLSEVDLGG